MMDCRCANRLPPLPGPDKALRELITSKSTSEVYSLSGHHGGAFSSGGARQHCAHRHCGNGGVIVGRELRHQCAPRRLVSAEIGSARRVRAAADGFRSSFASSEASWAAYRCLESLFLVYAISHGSRRTMFPLTTTAKLCRLLILPSGECS